MASDAIAILPARPEDASTIEVLQREAVRRLAIRDYSRAQIETALAAIGTLDRQLIDDGTYCVARAGGLIVGCGGWSFRERRIAGLCGRSGRLLDPAREPALIRGVFVHPDWSRRGVARRLVKHAEAAARAAGFSAFQLLATLTSRPFYERLGYRAVREVDLLDGCGVPFPAVEMTKACSASPT